MSEYYLEFEKPIQEIDEEILELRSVDTLSQDIKDKIVTLESKRIDLMKKIFSNLNRWQKVQVARHPNRPYTLDYIHHWTDDFLELHGDRYFGDDASLVTGLGTVHGQTIMFIGQQKGRNTKENLYRNFGMMRPEGYRKALRVMKLAEKFTVPVVSLLDTPGAYPGLGAEERGQGEAIARNLLEMAKLKVPIVSVVIGEGASGGALGIGICDRMLMLENTWFSVISPEGCASILWRDASEAPSAAESLQLTAEDLKKMGICDKIIQEPPGGAHRNLEDAATILKEVIIEELNALSEIPSDQFLDRRLNKYDQLGVFSDS